MPDHLEPSIPFKLEHPVHLGGKSGTDTGKKGMCIGDFADEGIIYKGRFADHISLIVDLIFIGEIFIGLLGIDHPVIIHGRGDGEALEHGSPFEGLDVQG